MRGSGETTSAPKKNKESTELMGKILHFPVPSGATLARVGSTPSKRRDFEVRLALTGTLVQRPVAPALAVSFLRASVEFASYSEEGRRSNQVAVMRLSEAIELAEEAAEAAQAKLRSCRGKSRRLDPFQRDLTGLQTEAEVEARGLDNLENALEVARELYAVIGPALQVVE